jgi:hypothetical protein
MSSFGTDRTYMIDVAYPFKLCEIMMNVRAELWLSLIGEAREVE